jgi:pyruvate kinase
MARACKAAEKNCYPDILEEDTEASVETNAVTRSVIRLTMQLPIKKIVVGSVSGKTVAAIARHRPEIKILTFVTSETLMRQLNIFRNVIPMYIRNDLPSDRDWLVSALAQYGVDSRHLRPEDMIILVTGAGVAGKKVNSIVEIAKVFDVCDL